jgi:SAM-dependent methyltransferase
LVKRSKVFFPLFLLVVAFSLSAHPLQPQKPSSSRMLQFDRLLVTVEDFKAQGYILDIGGGGEGIIGQLKGQQVIAIDISKRELDEAPPGPLKIVMDARDLKFVDKSFATSTVFFTFMYIDGQDHLKVFQELYRVLVDGGRLLIWDVLFPERIDDQKDMAVFPLKITLPDKEIATGYGVRWPKEGRGLDHFLGLAEEVGFSVVLQKVNENWFYLELEKKYISGPLLPL